MHISAYECFRYIYFIPCNICLSVSELLMFVQAFFLISDELRNYCADVHDLMKIVIKPYFQEYISRMHQKVKSY